MPRSASMRPSGITDGIPRHYRHGIRPDPRCFNEAVGYYRRNHSATVKVLLDHRMASMRPSGITDGIQTPWALSAT